MQWVCSSNEMNVHTTFTGLDVTRQFVASYFTIVNMAFTKICCSLLHVYDCLSHQRTVYRVNTDVNRNTETTEHGCHQQKSRHAKNCERWTRFLLTSLSPSARCGWELGNRFDARHADFHSRQQIVDETSFNTLAMTLKHHLSMTNLWMDENMEKNQSGIWNTLTHILGYTAHDNNENIQTTSKQAMQNTKFSRWVNATLNVTVSL